MKDFLAKVRAALAAFKTKCNEALKGLPELDKIDSGSELGWGIKSIQGSIKWMEERSNEFEQKVAEMEKEAEAAVATAAETLCTSRLEAHIQQKITAGELFTKESAAAHAESAAQARETAVRAEVSLIATRRTELASGDSPIASDVVALFSDDLLKADDYKVRASKAATRVKELTDLGVKQPKVLSEAAHLPADEAGDQRHADNLAVFRSVAQTHGGNPTPPAPSLTGTGKSEGNTPKELKVLF